MQLVFHLIQIEYHQIFKMNFKRIFQRLHSKTKPQKTYVLTEAKNLTRMSLQL